jgi:pilus assembly protein CpaB
LALVAAGAAAFMVRGLLGGGTPPADAKPAPAPIAMSEVLVASTNLTPGQKLLAEQVRWEKWPTASVDPSFVTHNGASSVEEIVKGAVVRSSIFAGQPIVNTAIVHADAAGFMAAMLTPGMRAVSIEVSAKSGAGGFVLPNDHVDLIQIRMIGDTAISKTVLSNVRVLAVGQTLHQEKDAKTVMGETATVEVLPEQAELLSSAQAQSINRQLALALRPLGDTEEAENVAGMRRKKSSANSDGPVAVIRYGMAAGNSAQQERPQ